MGKANWYMASLLSIAVAGCSDGAMQSIEYPPNQRAFHALNQQCKQAYAAGQNEIQKSLAFNQCNRRRADFANGEKVSGWVGRLTDISTDQGADVVSVTIESTIDGFDVMYSTVSNRVSDFATDSLITPSNPLFNVLAKMKEGDWVAFDATLLAHPEGDRGLWEGSLTEEGSMGEPEFNVRFSSIRPYGVAATERVAEQPRLPTQPKGNDQYQPASTNASVGSADDEALERAMKAVDGAIASSEATVPDQPVVGGSYQQGRFLYREMIDGPYWNDWYAASQPSHMPVNGYVSLHVIADGKLPFEGDLTLDCSDGQQSWQNTSVASEEVEGTVPDEAISSAIKVFCADSASVAVVDTSAGDAGPSFDCSIAKTPSEKAICGNSRLARVDAYTAKMYRCLLDRDPKARDSLRAVQRAWIPKRDACKEDVGCLRGAYGEIAEAYMANRNFSECQRLAEG